MALQKLAVFGDSIFAGVEAVDGFAYPRPVSDIIRWKLKLDVTNYSVGGKKFSDALKYWNGTVAGSWPTITPEIRASYDYILIEGFHNGEGITEAQALVDQINLDKKPSCKIFQTISIPTIPAIVGYAAYNAGLAALTGIHGVVDEFWDILHAGNGELKEEYWFSASDKLHTNLAGKYVLGNACVKVLKANGCTVEGT